VIAQTNTAGGYGSFTIDGSHQTYYYEVKR